MTQMNVLVVGQGGREHALVRALKSSRSVLSVHAVPGSDGIAADALCHPISWRDINAVRSFIEREKIHLVVIGPETPLAEGLSDLLRDSGIDVVGPSAAAARLESSKIYSKEFMVEAGVRTARYKVVGSVQEVRNAARDFSPPFVLKADGLAAGKGVFICHTLDDLLDSARLLFEDKSLGEAGGRALLEEFQSGYEISYLVLTNGETFEPLVLAQDHKRLMNGDVGPNTGGMGVVAPVVIDEKTRERINREAIAPSVAHLKRRGLLYRGVLYVGLMMTKDGPSVLEYNVRFGDPEAQVILPLMAGDWAEVFKDLARGKVTPLSWKNEATCCVVLAAKGYPDQPEQGAIIAGLERATLSESRYFLHAGTKKDSSGNWATSGGRVLNAIGSGTTLSEAVKFAYAQAREVSWEGMQFRNDIGAKILTGDAYSGV
jgi:phosphoribosylamine--glycine ligase